MTNLTQQSPLSCEACRIIDKTDGVEDGQLFSLEHWKVTNERVHWKHAREVQDKVSDRITGFAGSLNFVYLHILWFIIWVALNVGLIGASFQFDEYPFGLLTMIVSLEAIFLSTFVMVSQNHQAARANIRSQVDFESNLQSLIWLVHLAHKSNVDVAHVDKLCAEAIAESRNMA
jgi:uncharacterized membrane protein